VIGVGDPQAMIHHHGMSVSRQVPAMSCRGSSPSPWCNEVKLNERAFDTVPRSLGAESAESGAKVVSAPSKSLTTPDRSLHQRRR
jgi:hypothetical protein